MKKVLAVLFLFSLILFPPTIYASTEDGMDCQNAGGTCKNNQSFCFDNEVSVLGLSENDCPVFWDHGDALKNACCAPKSKVPTTPVVKTGELCKSKGGTCKLYSCDRPGDELKTIKDCPEGGDYMGTVRGVCCKPKFDEYTGDVCRTAGGTCQLTVCANNLESENDCPEGTDTTIGTLNGYCCEPSVSADNIECDSGQGTGIKTALGCIPTGNLNTFVGWVFRNLIFIASGIAFLLMAFGAIQILTSAGKPESVKAGGELITSAVSGLVLIILSVFLLQLIGVDILHIPGF